MTSNDMTSNDTSTAYKGWVLMSDRRWILSHKARAALRAAADLLDLESAPPNEAVEEALEYAQKAVGCLSRSMSLTGAADTDMEGGADD